MSAERRCRRPLAHRLDYRSLVQSNFLSRETARDSVTEDASVRVNGELNVICEATSPIAARELPRRC